MRRSKKFNLRIQRIPLTGHEYEIFPQWRPVIWDIQEEMTAVEISNKIHYPYTRYPLNNIVGSPELPGKPHLTKP